MTARFYEAKFKMIRKDLGCKFIVNGPRNKLLIRITASSSELQKSNIPGASFF